LARPGEGGKEFQNKLLRIVSEYKKENGKRTREAHTTIEFRVWREFHLLLIGVVGGACSTNGGERAQFYRIP
jgi:hypothetical protein